MKIRKILIVFAIAAVMLSLFAVAAFADDTNTVYEYYYTQLSSDEKLAYDVMRTNVETASSAGYGYAVNGFTGVELEYSLVGMNASDVSTYLNIETGTSEVAAAAKDAMNSVLKASTAFFYDHPEYYWVNGTIQASVGLSTRTSSGGSGYMIDGDGKVVDGTAVITPYVYFLAPGAGYATELAAVKAAVADIGATSGSDYDKVKTIHDYLCDKITYNTPMAEDPSTYGPGNTYNAMIGHYTVCQGYAQAFKMACDTFGVDSICVPGWAVDNKTSKSEGHMWNFVKINGKWYGLDATWDDQTTIMRDFFLVGSDTVPEHFDEVAFDQSHKANVEFTIPELNEYSCVTLKSAGVDVSGKSYAVNVSVNEGMGVDIDDVKIVVDGIDAAQSGGKFVSEAIRLDKALEDVEIGLYVGTDLCDSVTFSFEDYMNCVNTTLSKDLLQLVSVLDIYKGGDGVTVTGATEVTSLVSRTTTKKVIKKSDDDYVNSASLRIDENINVIFYNVCSNAAKAVISATGITDVTIEENLERVYSDDVSFTDLDRVFTITLFDTSEGVLAQTQYSALDYIYNKYSSADAKLASVCKALYAVYKDVTNVPA